MSHVTIGTPSEVMTLRRAEVRYAWALYLEELREVEPARYDEVEPWAWEQLQARLRKLREDKP